MRTFSQNQNKSQKLGSAGQPGMTPGLHHRRHPIHHLSRPIGDQAMLLALRAHAQEHDAGLTGTASPRFEYDFSRVPVHPSAAGAIQKKLAINKPGDGYEQEAERVSEQVMRMPDRAPHRTECTGCVGGGGPCPECAEEESKMVQARPLASQIWPLVQRQATGEPQEEAKTLQAKELLRSPGQPLDLATRAFMQSRFGHDFSQVRVHTDADAARSAQALKAQAYTIGNEIVFDLGRFDPTGAGGRRLLAHELAHVIQQSAGYAPPAVARQPVDAEKKSPKDAPKPSGCHTGCAQRWGQDTTCSKWGFFQGVAEHGEGKNWRSISCCNSWPLSVEDYARTQLGLSGAASCTAQHEREIATVSFGGNEVEVLCSDTIPGSMFGESASASACSGSIATEVIEVSPKAMQDLSGQLANALHVNVCYSGAKEDLCLHNGPGAKSFPTISQCLTKGCSPWEDTPTTHKDSGWPRS